MAERKDIIRTRKAIWQAYLDLSREKPFSLITASDVIKQAGVSRGTFYGHYRDIQQLRGEIEKDFCSITAEALLPAIRHLFTNTERAMFHILRFFEKNREMIKAVTAQGSSESYFLFCKDRLGKDILRCACTGKTDEGMILKAMIMSSMIIDQGRDVVMEGMNYTIAQRAHILYEVVRNGIPSGD
ncbi:MAG: TetR/AcrR family transcriptional regulator [Bulleidia sp.]